jgi:hypothetical protein
MFSQVQHTKEDAYFAFFSLDEFTSMWVIMTRIMVN